jgi:RNA polymerase sigma-70 factor (ECF subfamily)
MTKSNTPSDPIICLEMLYNQHGPAILRYLHRLVGPIMAEDVLQETFVQAATHIDRLDSVVSPKAWLFKVAKNMAFNHLRKKRLQADIVWSSLVKSSLHEDGRLEPMRRAIQTLPSDQRETVLLRWYDELSYEEISQVLRIPLGTVRSRLHHALHKLHQQIDREK